MHDFLFFLLFQRKKYFSRHERYTRKNKNTRHIYFSYCLIMKFDFLGDFMRKKVGIKSTRWFYLFYSSITKKKDTCDFGIQKSLLYYFGIKLLKYFNVSFFFERALRKLKWHNYILFCLFLDSDFFYSRINFNSSKQH